MAPIKDPGPITFTAELLGDPSGGSYVLFPGDVPSLYGVPGRVPICVHFRKTATGPMREYKGSMVRMGLPQHCILILKAIREALGLEVGKPVHVTVSLDTSERRVDVPPVLQAALAAAKVNGSGGAATTALDLFLQQSYTCQKEYVQWVEEAKKEETRDGRVSKTVDMVQAMHGKGRKMKGPSEDAAGLRTGGAAGTSKTDQGLKASSAVAAAGTSSGAAGAKPIQVGKSTAGKRGRDGEEAATRAEKSKPSKRRTK